MAFFGSFTPKPLLLIGTPSWLPFLQYTAAVLGKALRKSIRNLVLKRQYKVTVKKGKSVFLACRFGDVVHLVSCIHSEHCLNLHLRSGGRDLRSSQVYPRSFGDWIARNHKAAT